MCDLLNSSMTPSALTTRTQVYVTPDDKWGVQPGLLLQMQNGRVHIVHS